MKQKAASLCAQTSLFQAPWDQAVPVHQNGLELETTTCNCDRTLRNTHPQSTSLEIGVVNILLKLQYFYNSTTPFYDYRKRELPGRQTWLYQRHPDEKHIYLSASE